MDGRVLLASLADAIAPLVIFDPQYRGVLDHLQFGNEGARQSRRHALPAMPDSVIAEFVPEIGRVLQPSGHLMLWGDKFSIGTARHLQWLAGTTLEVVDVVTWDTGRFGMGWRTRSRAQYVLVIQKPPTRAKGVWHSHSIADVWPEKVGRAAHPHAKPVALQRALIEAVTQPGDLIIDPAAGSYSVLKAARICGREFLGCDLKAAP